jgi:hypothetical protein
VGAAASRRRVDEAAASTVEAENKSVVALRTVADLASFVRGEYFTWGNA